MNDTIEQRIKHIKFQPISRYPKRGGEQQFCEFMFSKVRVMNFTFIPYAFNFLSSISDLYVPDILIQKDTPLAHIAEEFGGNLSSAYYTEEDFYLAEFKTIENTAQFIDAYNKMR